VGIKEEAEFNCVITLFRSRYICYMRHILKPLFEHMLLIDYGIDQADDSKLDIGFNRYDWPKRRREFDDLCSALTEWAQCFPLRFCYDIARWLGGLNSVCNFDLADLAIMLYYYDTHRKPPNPVDYDNGMTGYFGVLQELISEVPFRGTGRLQRKLSVDINELIPTTVKDPNKRRRMISIVRKITAQYNIPLYGTISNINKPPFERMYKDGFRRRNWEATFKAFFSFLPYANSKTQDEESEPLINKELLLIME
jgi:hypothetical protein